MDISSYRDEFNRIFGNPLLLGKETMDETDGIVLASKALVFIAYQLAILNDAGIETWPHGED